MSPTKLPQTLVLTCVLAASWVSAAVAQPMMGPQPRGAGSAAPPPKAPPPAAPPKAAPPQATATSQKAPAPSSVAGARLESGVVAVLRSGQPVALGLVLGGDGRIVTSRAGLAGNTKNIIVRYADGSNVTTSVGHEDRANDLALLVPQRAGWTEGFVPSARPIETGAVLGSYQVQGKEVGRVLIRPVGAAGASMLDLDVSGPTYLGSPALDQTSQAAGIIVSTCDVAAEPKCKPKTRLATVSSMRAFLRTIPASATIPTAYLGVRGERAIGNYARGVRVLDVTPGSPADKAKLVAGAEGDLVLAVGGRPVTTPDELTAALRAHAPGDAVALTLFSKGAYREVAVVLTPGPSAVAPPAKPTPSPAGSPSGAPKDFKGPR